MEQIRESCHEEIRKFLESHNIPYHYYFDRRSAFQVILASGNSIFIQIDYEELADRPFYIYHPNHTIIRVPPGVSLEKEKFVEWGLIDAEKKKLWCVTMSFDYECGEIVGVYDSFEKATASARRVMLGVPFTTNWIETSAGHWKFRDRHVDIDEYHLNEDV